MNEIDRERFTHTRRSCVEPDRSVGKAPVGELSLSSEEECLSPRVVYHEQMSLYSGNSKFLPCLKPGDSLPRMLKLDTGRHPEGDRKGRFLGGIPLGATWIT